MGGKATTEYKSLASLAESAYADFSLVINELERLSASCVKLAEACLRKHGKYTANFFKPIRSELVKTLSSIDPMVYGVSVVVDEGVIEKVPFELYLVERDQDGAIVNDSNIKYPWRAGFYEYSNVEWMVVPRISGKTEIVGPFVDIDKYIISLVAPIIVEDHFIGVTGADIRLSDYERRLARSLCKLSSDAGIVNSEGRVVLSNCASHPVGSLVEIESVKCEPCGNTRWSAVLFADE